MRQKIENTIISLMDKLADERLPIHAKAQSFKIVCDGIEELVNCGIISINKRSDLEESIATTNDSLETIKKEFEAKTRQESNIRLSVERDAMIAKEIDEQSKIMKRSTPFTKESNESYSNTGLFEKGEYSTNKIKKWTESELRLIDSVTQKSTPKSRKTLDYLIKKLPERTESAIRSKLNSLGIFVIDGKLHKGKI